MTDAELQAIQNNHRDLACAISETSWRQAERDRKTLIDEVTRLREENARLKARTWCSQCGQDLWRWVWRTSWVHGENYE
jgi:hypothetical protein